MNIQELFGVQGLDRSKASACDFCAGPNPLVRYLVQDIKTVEIEAELTSVGEWLACASCAALIVQSDIEGLIELASERLQKQLGNKVALSVIAATVRQSHGRFWQAWKHH